MAGGDHVAARTGVGDVEHRRVALADGALGDAQCVHPGRLCLGEIHVRGRDGQFAATHQVRRAAGGRRGDGADGRGAGRRLGGQEAGQVDQEVTLEGVERGIVGQRRLNRGEGAQGAAGDGGVGQAGDRNGLAVRLDYGQRADGLKGRGQVQQTIAKG